MFSIGGSWLNFQLYFDCIPAYQLLPKRVCNLYFSLKSERCTGRGGKKRLHGTGQPLLVHSAFFAFCGYWWCSWDPKRKDQPWTVCIILERNLILLFRTSCEAFPPQENIALMQGSLKRTTQLFFAALLKGSRFVFQFMYPLPREQGYKFMYAEFKDHKCYFTSLLHYQVRIIVLTLFSETILQLSSAKRRKHVLNAKPEKTCNHRQTTLCVRVYEEGYE